MAKNCYSVKSLNRYSGGKDAAQPPQSGRFQTFEDLEAYQAAREFRKAMYEISRRLPDFEKNELNGYGRHLRQKKLAAQASVLRDAPEESPSRNQMIHRERSRCNLLTI